ncbi:hypothetical protein O9992_28645 [Vibrio lentus]|nr:hypothetical protein [Vibrio lentus]
MLIEPIIKGVVAKSAHPLGCKEAVKQQIKFVKSAPQIKDGPKRVLIIGASSGFPVCCSYRPYLGGAKADTTSASHSSAVLMSATSGHRRLVQQYLPRKEAEREQRNAINTVGDAFHKRHAPKLLNIETY